MAEATSTRVPTWGTSRATLATLGRHQLGAAVATALDFATMILLVQGLGASPVLGTAVGASLGGIVNFVLGRAWVFRGQTGRWTEQAVRYAVGSACGAGLNAFGEHLVNGVAHVHYVLARVMVSIVVSLAWSFPVQRRIVFRDGEPRRQRQVRVS
jgi:putative flippase GtrA